MIAARKRGCHELAIINCPLVIYRLVGRIGTKIVLCINSFRHGADRFFSLLCVDTMVPL